MNWLRRMLDHFRAARPPEPQPGPTIVTDPEQLIVVHDRLKTVDRRLDRILEDHRAMDARLSAKHY